MTPAAPYCPHAARLDACPALLHPCVRAPGHTDMHRAMDIGALIVWDDANTGWLLAEGWCVSLEPGTRQKGGRDAG